MSKEEELPTPTLETPRSNASTSSQTSDDRPETGNYSIVVRTASKPHAGTSASVFVQLTDVEGNKTDKVRLKCSISHRKKFQKGHADLFMLVDQNYMSQLKTVDVWHQRRGRKDAWLLHSIDVIDHQTNMLYHFPCGNWLGHSSDDTYYNMNFVSLDAVGQPVSAISRKDFAPQNHS